MRPPEERGSAPIVEAVGRHAHGPLEEVGGMRSWVVVLVSVFLVSLGGSLLCAEELTKEQQAKVDSDKLLALYKDHWSKFAGIDGENAVHETNEEYMLQKCAKLEGKLKVLDTEVLPVVQPFLAEVGAKYGWKYADFEWELKQLKVAEYDEAGDAFDNLTRGIANVGKTRVASAEYLANYVKSMPDPSFFVPDVRVKQLQQWKVFLQYALKFDPTNAYANERLAKMDREIADCQKNIDKEIDAKSWAGHVADFAGPGTATELARVAMDYFRKDKGWGKQGENVPEAERGKGLEIVAVAVRGPWQVAETDIFGRVITYRLPIHLAVTQPSDKSRNIARVYELSCITQEAAPGQAKQAPPFDGFWVGNSWMMRLNKIAQPK
jgi:hypothetical protein